MQKSGKIKLNIGWLSYENVFQPDFFFAGQSKHTHTCVLANV